MPLNFTALFGVSLYRSSLGVFLQTVSHESSSSKRCIKLKIKCLDELSTVGVAGHNSAEILSSLRVKQRSVQRRKRPVSGHQNGNS